MIRAAILISIGEVFYGRDNFRWVSLVSDFAFVREAEGDGLFLKLGKTSVARDRAYGAMVASEFAAFAPHIEHV